MTTFDRNLRISEFPPESLELRILQHLGVHTTEEASLTVDAVLRELAVELQQWEALRNAYGTTCDLCWQTIGLGELIQHIEATHHGYLRLDLPRLQALLHRLINRESESVVKPMRKALEAFVSLKAEIEMHLMKEEQILFPMIRELEVANAPIAFHCGSLRNPVGVMMMEHDNAKNALGTIRQALAELGDTARASLLVRATVAGLRHLDADLSQHIREEDDILFPRAIALEDELCH